MIIHLVIQFLITQLETSMFSLEHEATVSKISVKNNSFT
jgi:hypothetical protein